MDGGGGIGRIGRPSWCRPGGCREDKWFTRRSNTATLAAGRTAGHGYPSYTPPPAYYGGGQRPRIVQFNSNDQFDTNGNINPGGGGGGTKPGKSPNLK